MNFFGKSKGQKSPNELVRNLRDAIARLDTAGTGTENRRKVGYTACDGTLTASVDGRDL